MPTVLHTLSRYATLALMFMAFTVALKPHIAQASLWSQVASTCAVDENAQGKYNFLGSVMQFLPNAVSDRNRLGHPLPMTLRCNVLNPYEVTSPAWGSMYVTYQDSDGPGDNSRLVVRLIKISRTDGGFVPIAVFDSNMYPATTGNFARQLVTYDSSHMDFATHQYVVTADLYRKTIASNPRFKSVQLDE